MTSQKPLDKPAAGWQGRSYTPLLSGPMKLSDWMKATGITVAELAKLLGISRQSIYLWLSGDTSPSAKHVEALRVLSGDSLNLNKSHGEAMNHAPSNGRHR